MANDLTPPKLELLKPHRPRQANGKFAPGQPAPNTHRPRGAKNKIPKDLKATALAAAVELGSDGLGTEGLVGYFKMNHEIRDRVLLESLPQRAKDDAVAAAGGSGIDADGNNTRFHIEVVPIMSGYMELPNGHYAPYEEAGKIWEAHKAQLAAEAPIPIWPLARVEDPDGLPPAA